MKSEIKAKTNEKYETITTKNTENRQNNCACNKIRKYNFYLYVAEKRKFQENSR